MLRKLGLFVAAATIGVIPSATFADHREHDRGDYRGGSGREWRRDDHRDYDRDRGGGGRIDIRIGGGGGTYCPPPPPPVCEERVWVPATYRTVVERRWVEPVYRTVCDRVWVEAVTRTDGCERTWVPDRYEWRDVEQRANGRRYYARQYVLVEAAHWADVPRVVVITPGHYEDRPRQELVCAGHFENCERQDLVCEGHWETRPVVVAQPVRRYDESYVRFGLKF
jgi:hypothetical protein